MNEKFAVKKINCNSYSDVSSKIIEAEILWITSVLSRANVPLIMITKALSDATYSKGAWRDYLFDTHQLLVVKSISKNKVVITKVDTNNGSKLVLGEWLKPEVVKVQGEDKVSYDINLKYWQIV